MPGDPAKEVALLIAKVEAGMKSCTQELIQYKANEKQLEIRQRDLAARIEDWEKKAMDAVRAGDDELAKKALKEKAWAESEHRNVRAEREEQARIAGDMLRSRRRLVQQLETLKARQGTIAQQIAQGRGESPFDVSKTQFEKFEQAENRVEDQAALIEVDAMDMSDEQMNLARLREQTKLIEAEGALADLKKKMQEPKASGKEEPKASGKEEPKK
jgi:phage shock protein A